MFVPNRCISHALSADGPNPYYEPYSSYHWYVGCLLLLSLLLSLLPALVLLLMRAWPSELVKC